MIATSRYILSAKKSRYSGAVIILLEQYMVRFRAVSSAHGRHDLDTLLGGVAFKLFYWHYP
jgi:hypothetical protein